MGTADPHAPIRVLLVDDDADFLDLAATLLERESDAIETLTETDPRAAIDRLEGTDVDCLVSDYRMPDLDGLDLLDRVRRSRPDLPFVLFTGQGSEEIASEAIAAGVTDYIPKGSPDEYPLSARRIENAVAKRRAEARARRHTRLNALIRDVMGTLIDESTRAALERQVCDRLVTFEPYDVAWIGEGTGGDATVVPRERAAATGEPPAWVAPDADPAGDTPEAAALSAGEVRVVDDIADAPGDERWRSEALEGGMRSAIAVPLVHRELPFGVLGVYADRPDLFAGAERDILAELGDLIAYAINAIERRVGLGTDDRVEVELRVDGADIPFVALARELDCEARLATAITNAGEGLTAFYDVQGATPEQVVERFERASAVAAAELVTREQGACTVAVEQSAWFGDAFVEYGAALRAARADAGAGRVIVDLPAEVDVSGRIEAFVERYPEAELVARRHPERPVGDESGRRIDPGAHLTDRQHEVIETAYRAGYFEWPRATTGEGVARMLDIAQPTFNQHCRTAERELLAAIFEDDA